MYDNEKDLKAFVTDLVRAKLGKSILSFQAYQQNMLSGVDIVSKANVFYYVKCKTGFFNTYATAPASQTFYITSNLSHLNGADTIRLGHGVLNLGNPSYQLLYNNENYVLIDSAWSGVNNWNFEATFVGYKIIVG